MALVIGPADNKLYLAVSIDKFKASARSAHIELIGSAVMPERNELRSKVLKGISYPEGPSTQYLRTLVPKTIPLMVFGTKGLKYWVLGPSGLS